MASSEQSQEESGIDEQVQSDNVGFLYDLISAPCFRQSAMYGIGGGATIGALRLAANRKDIVKAAETTVQTGCAVSIITWILCRRQYYAEREMTYESMDKYRRQVAVRAAARAKAMRDQNQSTDRGNHPSSSSSGSS